MAEQLGVRGITRRLRMRARACLLLVVVLLSVITASHAEIYKCEDRFGRPAFSDTSCADDAQIVTLKIPQATGVDLGSTGDYSEIASANQRRDMARRVAAMEDKLQQLRQSHQASITALDSRLAGLPNNPRGVRERERLKQNRKSLRDDYDRSLKRANEKMKALRGKQRGLR